MGVLDSLLEQLGNNENVKIVVETLRPFFPVLKRESEELVDEFIDFVVKGEWTEVDRLMWEKMTDDERDQLSQEVLSEARDAVDAAFRRNEFAKQVAFKVATSLLTALL